LGNVALQETAEIRAHQKSLLDEQPMRIRDFLKAVNSTPIGEVLNERKLFRQRVKARGQFCAGKRVKMLAYGAWLADLRHACVEGRPAGAVSQQNVLSLLKFQEYRCALTGRPLSTETVALDHIVPMSRGGQHNIDNAQALHKEVNKAKGTMSNEDFIQMCREVVKWANRHAAKDCQVNHVSDAPESGPGAALGADRRSDRDPGQAGTLAHPVANGAQGAA